MVAADPDERIGRNLFGRDRPADLVRVVAAVIAFAVVDRLVARASQLGFGDGEQATLVGVALMRNWAPTAVLVIAVAVVIRLGGSRVRGGWSSMDRGEVWRGLAIPWVIVAAWYGAAYEFNFMLGRWHVIDRTLVVALAVAAIAHPLFLLPFVLQTQIVASQLLLSFGAATARGADRLVIVAILVIATTWLLVMASGDDDTSPGLLLLVMAIGAHFFVPGRAKIGLDWATTTDLQNFAYSSYTTGWRGAGDGGWARSLASSMRTMRWPLIIGTMIVEVGAGVAVFHRRLVRWWLPCWIGLHAAIFAVSGFWLFGWFVVELGLLLVLWRRDLVEWTARNDTLARGAIAVVVVVVFGSAVFSPPRLGWLDAPVSYGYEIEAVGVSGATYHVPLDEFGEAQQDLVFLFARFADHPPVVAGYGATAGSDFYDRLGRIRSFAELRELEQTFTPVSEAERATSERLVLRWVDHVNESNGKPWFLISPPSRFWVDRPEPTFDRGERLASVEVILARSLHDDDGQRFDRETVLRIEAGDDGRAAVTFRAGEVANG